MSENSNPPYMTYGVFKAVAETLDESTVPSGPLDRRVLDKLSGADHGALMSGLTFLGYVDDERRATPKYRELIKSVKNPKEFQAKLYETISVSYADILGNLNVESGTLGELEKAFKAYGVPAGQMLTKVIRFYVKAMQECGFTVSPHITKPKPRTPRKNNGEKSRANSGAQNPASQSMHYVEGPPKGFERMPIPGIYSAFIQYPISLTEPQVMVFEAMVKALRTYAVANKTGGQEEKI